MRNILLTSVAAAAVATAAVTAGIAQRAEPQGAPAASSQQQPGTSKAGGEQKGRAPATQSQPMQDKGAPKGAQAPSGRQTTGTGGTEDKRSQGAPKGDRLDRAQNQPAGGAKPDDKAGQRGAQQDQQKSGKDVQKSGASEMKRDSTGAAKGAQPDAQKSDRQPRTGASEQKSKERSTTGQTPPDREMDRTKQRGERSQPPAAGQQGQPGQTTTAPSGRSDDRAGSRQDTTRQERSTTSTSAEVKPEVQSRFTETISKQKVRSETNVNFSVSVGSRVPRSVRYYDVPRDIVQIDPGFRGKKYMVVRDEIVIIEPRTNEVVTVIPRSGRATSGTTTSVRQTTSSRIQLAPEQRRVIRETVIREQAAPRCEDFRISIGESVPRTIRLGPFPEDVVREVPEIRSYRFCVRDNDVVLIDPTEYTIVEVIE
jgi:Protein of unknown function (DUF1236)